MTLLFLDYHKNHELYSEDDIKNVIIHSMPLSMGIVTDISPDVKLVLSNSGHILGSTSIHLHIGNGNHNLVYTGDLKFGKTNLLENASWNFPRVETLIIEGTFGSKDLPHKREETDPILIESINQTLRDGGRVLIPVPIIGLSQELIYTLTKYQEVGSLDPSAEIFVDKSVLEATYMHELYYDYLSKEVKTKILNENTSIFNYKNLKLLNSKSKVDKPGIILVPSSMLIGGLSVKFLKQIHNDPFSKIIFISNQGTGTLGKEIQTGNTEVTIDGQQLKLKCKIHAIHGFSNHSDYNQLLAYISRLKPKLKRVVINHGEKPRVQNLASSVNKILNIQCQYLLVPEAIKLL
jgi:predicted metal-dependent RNase